MTKESLKIPKPTSGSTSRPVSIPTLKLCVHHLHISLHLDHRSLLHLVNAQSSQESIPFLFREANPQVDRKPRLQALNQAAGQAPLPGGPVQVSQTSWKKLPHLP